MKGYMAFGDMDHAQNDISCEAGVLRGAFQCNVTSQCQGFTLDLGSGQACTKSSSVPTSTRIGTCLYTKLGAHGTADQLLCGQCSTAQPTSAALASIGSNACRVRPTQRLVHRPGKQICHAGLRWRWQGVLPAKHGSKREIAWQLSC